MHRLAPTQGAWERVELFTDYARMTCDFPIFNYSRLKDALESDAARRAFEVRDLEIRPHVLHPAGAPAHQALGVVLRTGICCAVPLGQIGPTFALSITPPHLRRDGVDHNFLYVHKQRQPTILTCGPYLVEGDVHLLPEAELLDVLQAPHGAFVAVTDATLHWSTAQGPQELACRTVLLNRERLELVTLLAELPTWDTVHAALSPSVLSPSA